LDYKKCLFRRDLPCCGHLGILFFNSNRSIDPKGENQLKIIDLLKQSTPVFSFEFFPPKTEEGEKKLFETIEELSKLHPSFVSVTYGAGGSTRDKTVGWVSRIKNELGIEAMAHLTCVGSSRDELNGILLDLDRQGIENVLALRGDPPKGQKDFKPHPEGFRYANELAEFIQSHYDFCLGGAAFPEIRPDSPSVESDLFYLKKKSESGLDFLITQLFFDNRFYFDFISRAKEAGIRIPIIPGIMPITDVAQVERFTSMCGATIPQDLHAALRKVEADPEAVIHLGVQHATEQCVGLLENGAPGVHFYTLNKSPATREIFKRLLNR
jgi:methylenetetrahydrofolate reductase (NADPH)